MLWDKVCFLWHPSYSDESVIRQSVISESAKIFFSFIKAHFDDLNTFSKCTWNKNLYHLYFESFLLLRLESLESNCRPTGMVLKMVEPVKLL